MIERPLRVCDRARVVSHDGHSTASRSKTLRCASLAARPIAIVYARRTNSGGKDGSKSCRPPLETRDLRPRRMREERGDPAAASWLALGSLAREFVLAS
jgi:hypothetical protein